MKRNLTNIEQAILNYIWEELQRLYWNEKQEDFDSTYCNDFKDFKDIKVTGYDWREPDEGYEDTPNIVINGKSFWFYKYYGRSMETDGEKLNEQWLEETLTKLNK
jgi:hypothetical protein